MTVLNAWIRHMSYQISLRLSICRTSSVPSCLDELQQEFKCGHVLLPTEITDSLINSKQRKSQVLTFTRGGYIRSFITRTFCKIMLYNYFPNLQSLHVPEIQKAIILFIPVLKFIVISCYNTYDLKPVYFFTFEGQYSIGVLYPSMFHFLDVTAI